MVGLQAIVYVSAVPITNSTDFGILTTDPIPPDFRVETEARTLKSQRAHGIDVLTSSLKSMGWLARQSYRSPLPGRLLPSSREAIVRVIATPKEGLEDDFDVRYAMWGLHACTVAIITRGDFFNEICDLFYDSRGGLLGTLGFTDGTIPGERLDILSHVKRQTDSLALQPLDSSSSLQPAIYGDTAPAANDTDQIFTDPSDADTGPEIGIKLKNFGGIIFSANVFYSTTLALIDRASKTPRRDNIGSYAFRIEPLRVEISYAPRSGSAALLKYETVTKGLTLIPKAMMLPGYEYRECEFVWYEDGRKVGAGSIRLLPFLSGNEE